MPTDEFKPLLDREEAVRNAAPLIAATAPLLREVVNQACWVFRLCNEPGSRVGGENEDVAAMTLYRHMIELVDGVEVLFGSACADAAVPLVRASFETSLALDYILDDDYTRRSLAWTCSYLHGRITTHLELDPSTELGARYAAVVDGRSANDELRPPRTYDSSPSVQGLESVLTRPEFKSIEDEYRRLRKKKGRRPEWFQLFRGPHDRRELARRVGREGEYAVFYPVWSSFSHAADGAPYIRSGRRPNELAFLAVRSPQGMQHRGTIIIGHMLRAMRKLLKHFRPDQDLNAWYVREVRAAWHGLRELPVTMVDLEAE